MTQEEAMNWALKKIESAMDKPKQPTAAAMRAAKEMGRNKCPTWGEFTIIQNAAIIDRETGLPELLEACKAAELARQSIARNRILLLQILSKHKLPYTRVEGVLRGLEHAKLAIRKAENE